MYSSFVQIIAINVSLASEILVSKYVRSSIGDMPLLFPGEIRLYDAWKLYTLINPLGDINTLLYKSISN